MGEFGDKFRKARTAKNLSFDDVSNVTKIGSRMLQAIEEEHFDQLPGGVFNRGFIRAYAKHLGLNEEDAVTEYLSCLRQAQVDAQTRMYEQSAAAAQRPPARPLEVPRTETPLTAPAPTPSVPAKSAPKPKPAPVPQKQGEELPDLQLPRAEHIRPPRRDYLAKRDSSIPWRLLAAALAIALGFVLWRNHRSAHPAPTAAAAPPAPANPSPAQTASAQITPATAAPSAPSPNSLAPSLAPTAVVRASQSASLPTSKPPTTPAAMAANNTNPASPTIAAKSIGNENPSNPEVGAPSAQRNAAPATKIPPPPAPAASKPAPARLALVIRASETSWISVTADGQPVVQETLIAPAHTSIRATREIVAHVGNAAGISFVWNGAEIPAQGGESEVKTYIFDTEGMRVVEASPTSTPNQ